LRSTSVKHQQKTTDSIQKLSTTLKAIDQLKEKITASDLKINALGDNLNTLNVINAELDKLKSELSSLTQQSFGRDNQQIEIASSVNELDTLIQLLVERIESLELKLAVSNALPKIQTPIVDTAAIND
jgi:chromosome segregation ATPase